ncbi:MAG TPA: bacteriocin [Ruminococcaceae bacterium]|mgnify:FL=1|jgi:uncharacterized linocin/CFP29 family protein|nr:bacteriocin [Oscillospiraceae bacterium]HBG56161.1 bacteriocin [Oscillospiraceae bacterium]HBQ46738.1 bacteriocin [Oscillospiraceae bacterium]HBT90869.1 bacteriocin [Oscillospiraceae bacterium]
MSYLSREASSLPEDLWQKIDSAVVEAARNVLTGRRFLHVAGPLGPGAEVAPINDADALRETEKDGLLTTQGRKFAEIPVLYEDFTLLARDLENAKQTGVPADLGAAARAAEKCALKEDRLIYFGNAELGYDGLLTAPGTQKIEKKDWSAGENAFSDIAAAYAALVKKGIYGTAALVVSPDLYLQMQRLQPGTGLLEIDRVAKLVGGHVYEAPALGTEKALLVGSNAGNMDLVIGQDLATAYLEQKDLNHSFRVVESVLLRIKRKDAVVVFE